MSLPKPYYESEKAVLYCGDCLEILPHLEGVDAVVTDPPYGIGWKPRVNNTGSPWIDDRPFNPEPFLEVGNEHVFWGANYFAGLLPTSSGWLCWVKRPLGSDFSRDERTYSTIELAWSDCINGGRYFAHCWDGGKRAGDASNRTFCHPAQKPVELMKWCLGFINAQTILDPFMGSGTTGVACMKLGRKFIGVEIELSYCEIAKRRIIEAEGQFALFEPPKKNEQNLLDLGGA